MKVEGNLMTNHVGKEFKGLRLKEVAQWFALSPHSKVSGSNPQGGQGVFAHSLRLNLRGVGLNGSFRNCARCKGTLNKAKMGSSLFLNGSSDLKGNTQLSQSKNI